MQGLVSAIFHDPTQAEQAVLALRRLGVPDQALSIVTRQTEHPEFAGGGGGGMVAEREDALLADATGKGILGGAGVGALFGLAAALIPGMGPFVAAGVLATTLGATGGAIAAGAVIGATSGAIAGALASAGYSERDAAWFGNELERGGLLVAVEPPASMPEREIRDVLVRHGGRIA